MMKVIWKKKFLNLFSFRNKAFNCRLLTQSFIYVTIRLLTDHIFHIPTEFVDVFSREEVHEQLVRIEPGRLYDGRLFSLLLHDRQNRLVVLDAVHNAVAPVNLLH